MRISSLALLAGLILFGSFPETAIAEGSSSPSSVGHSLAVHGEIVYPVSGPPIVDGVVVVTEGRITAIGSSEEVSIPEGTKVLNAAVVTPGLVDAHTVVGLAGYLNTPHDQDQLERSEPLQPELRALDAYDARAPLVEWVRSFGVTTIHTGHGPGAVISGQTLIAKTRGETVDEAVFVPEAMIASTLGEAAKGPEEKPPGTRSKVVAMLRQAFLEAQAYRDKLERSPEDKKPGRDLRKEALLQVLDGERPLMITAHRHQDIASTLRLQKELGFKLVLDGAADAHLLLDEIHEAGVPVLLHPTMARPGGERENLSMTTAAKLREAGIPFALQSGYEGYVPKTRVVLFEAAIAAAYGLGFEGALEAMTLSSARILGIDDRVGSLEVGKDGDLALYDGDPFEYTSHCVGVVIEGEVVSETVR